MLVLHITVQLVAGGRTPAPCKYTSGIFVNPKGLFHPEVFLLSLVATNCAIESLLPVPELHEFNSIVAEAAKLLVLDKVVICLMLKSNTRQGENKEKKHFI